ncbi:hypothetical protein EVAR_61208_1 [Eumeta japonica]|uniref:Uncharacterized protein n=1 Tax=Eumeta variegata TaxID=151549 RepID=A0A4C1YZC8_EUMVA|nr:hypothetical protein EVAR_61208_1 [Eumeta japonica]
MVKKLKTIQREADHLISVVKSNNTNEKGNKVKLPFICILENVRYKYGVVRAGRFIPDGAPEGGGRRPAPRRPAAAETLKKDFIASEGLEHGRPGAPNATVGMPRGALTPTIQLYD